MADTSITLNRADLVRRGTKLEYLTIGYNLLEAVVSLISGVVAGSIALIGFGLDSLIEVTSAGAVLWRLRADSDIERREHAERRALKIVAICFFALVGWIAYDSIKALWAGEAPEESLPGIVLAVTSLIVMPLLARAKRRVATAIESGALEADARQTDLCFYLSAILLAGLGLNAVFGWWWADPVAGLAMTPIVFKEGWKAWRGVTCAGYGPRVISVCWARAPGRDDKGRIGSRFCREHVSSLKRPDSSCDPDIPIVKFARGFNSLVLSSLLLHAVTNSSFCTTPTPGGVAESILTMSASWTKGSRSKSSRFVLQASLQELSAR